jgi:AcrR family transcriptional regulator
VTISIRRSYLNRPEEAANPVYRRYASKIKLFAAVMEAERRKVDALVSANILAAATPLETLRQTLRGVLETSYSLTAGKRGTSKFL